MRNSLSIVNKVIIVSGIILICFLAKLLIDYYLYQRILAKSPRVIYSSSFKMSYERVARLESESIIDIHSNVQDAAFIIDYGKPAMGPGVSQYTIAIKINPRDVKKWLVPGPKTPFKRCNDSFDYESDLKPFKIPWKHKSTPDFYSTINGNYMVVFKQEGIIAYCINQ